jgi:hypothetical protein
MIYGFRNPLVVKLIELGVLPPGVTDVTIRIPLEGAVTIDCEFYPDDRFNQAVAEVDTEKVCGSLTREEIIAEEEKRFLHGDSDEGSRPVGLLSAIK